MRALTWQERHHVEVREVPDPRIEEPDDAIVRVTSTAICGSDLHLYGVLGMFLDRGDILGHEAMGVVEEIGPGVTGLAPGDRVVVPFNIACGHCWMCDRQLFAQCETTQVREHGKGGALFGYTRLYGHVPGGQAELVRVPHADVGPIKVPDGPPDDRFLFLSDVLPTAWQAVAFADVPPGGSLGIIGLGPIGHMCGVIALHLGIPTVIGVDLVPDRLERARRRGIDVLDARDGDVAERLRDATGGRGPDAVIDAVGMEAHGAPFGAFAQRAVSLLPDRLAAPLAELAGVDRLAALLCAFDAVRRGGTVSITGVYGGQRDPLPMLELFDKGVQLRMGQAHVRRWIPSLLPLVEDERDPLGTEQFASHHLPLDEAPNAYERFQKKQDGTFKVVLRP